MNNDFLEKIKKGEQISIGKRFSFESKILHEKRFIQIHLPKKYFESEKVYPVMYLLDGEFHFNIVSSMLKYMENHMVPEMILIGIENLTIQSRLRDLSPVIDKRFNNEAGYDKFIEFINKEIAGSIDKYLRTSGYRIFSGHSLGGLAVVHTLMTHTDYFDFYIANSPALYFADNYQYNCIEKNIDKLSKLNKDLFISWGSEEETEENPIFTKIDELIYKKMKRIHYESLEVENESHGATPFEGNYYALKNRFKIWFDLKEADSVEKLKKHFEIVSKSFNYRVDIPFPVLNQLGYIELYRNNDIEKAIAVFKFAAEIYPNLWNSYDSLGEALMLKGDNKNAILFYRKSLEMNPENINAINMIKRIKGINS